MRLEDTRSRTIGNTCGWILFVRFCSTSDLANDRSAAFNLNTPLIDDIKGKHYTNPIEIGRRAVKLAALGGFDKVTWDGASDSYPSARES